MKPKSHLTIIQHAQKAVEHERTAAWLTVRGITEPHPDAYWCLAEVHRAWVQKLRTSV